jgi:addiction module HigA family antidote
MLKNIHPGEVLLEEFLKEYGISQNRLGREIGMSPRAINEIVHGKRSITANSALRLAKFFGTSPEFWLNLQTSYDLEEAAKEIDLGNIKGFEAA